MKEKNVRIIMEEVEKEIQYAGDYLEERLKKKFNWVSLAIRGPLMSVISSSFQFMKEKILEDIDRIYNEK